MTDGSSHRPLNDGPAHNVSNDVLTNDSAPASFPNMTPASDLTAVAAVAPFNEATTREIIRQVEYYFSDQNLPNDAHLLGLAGIDGNGPVSLNVICGWRKMRSYKPRKAIKTVLAHSAVLEVDEVNKKVTVRRRFPLKLQVNVRPQTDLARQNVDQILKENPHLTKAMLKPTGYEEYYTDAPITPEQFEQDRRRYDTDLSFEERIQTAVRHYSLRRKQHQVTHKLFQKWMEFGGFNTATNSFQGALDEADFEGLDKDDVAAMKCNYCVDEYITTDDDDDIIVDFQAVALAFLSTEFPQHFMFDDPVEISNVCNVMVNFFNYLLHHDVCPEYADQIMSARAAVRMAEPELCGLPKVDEVMRTARTFGDACTQLHKDQEDEGDSPWAESFREPLKDSDAMTIFKAGLVAYASETQMREIERRFAPFSDTDSAKTAIPEKSLLSPFTVVVTETFGMEVIALEAPEGEIAAYFDALSDTVVPRICVMRCRRWTIPGGALYDLPKMRPQIPQEFDVLVEEHILKACYIGMKLQAQIKLLDIGVCWVRRYERVYPSFFTSIFDIKTSKKLYVQDREMREWLQGRVTTWREDDVSSADMQRLANCPVGSANNMGLAAA